MKSFKKESMLKLADYIKETYDTVVDLDIPDILILINNIIEIEQPNVTDEIIDDNLIVLLDYFDVDDFKLLYDNLLSI